MSSSALARKPSSRPPAWRQEICARFGAWIPRYIISAQIAIAEHEASLNDTVCEVYLFQGPRYTKFVKM